MPILPAENRLIAIDLARGIAMLGVALVNVQGFGATWGSVYGLDLATSVLDVVAEYSIAVLFTHRSYPVLAFLFGAGLAFQWRGLPENDRSPARLRSRLWALLALGVAHGLLLWPGEILAAYAVIGLLLVTALRNDNRDLLRLTVILYALNLALYLWIGSGLMASAALFDSWRNSPASFASSSWTEAFSRRRVEYVERGLAQITVIDMWAHVLFGIWAAKSGALQRFIAAPLEHKRVLFASVALFVLGTGIELVAARYGGWSAATINESGEALMTFGLLPASVGAIGCWFAFAAMWARQQGVLASLVIAAGRAPLTQFIGQSIVFALLFNKTLLGGYGELGRGALTLIAVATYLLLCGLVRAWLVGGHAHGPMEILWRRLTKWLSPQPVKTIAIESQTS